jgi:hypothetical protein
MTSPYRYISSWPLPSYKFVPGKNIHPNKPGGHMHGSPVLIAPPIDLNKPEENNFLRFSLDLYNHQFYWESHVYLEALWNSHKRNGPVADFLKGLIKLGAAGVKMNLGDHTEAREHLNRAKVLLESVQSAEGNIFLGFDLPALIVRIDSDADHFIINPSWK